jgi:hypothetical protein
MKPGFLISIMAASLLAIGSALWLHAREIARTPGPKAELPPPVYASARQPAPGAGQVQQTARERNAQLGLEIERALVSRDPQQRETAFNFLLPELLQTEPQRVTDMVARQEPGEARDALRDAVARQWITRDRDNAIRWMQSFESTGEQQASARVAVQALAATAPDQAIAVADQFGIGRDDGSLEHLVQVWAEDDLEQATRWLESQPAGPRTEQMRARIEQVRAAREARDPQQ